MKGKKKHNQIHKHTFWKSWIMQLRLVFFFFGLWRANVFLFHWSKEENIATTWKWNKVKMWHHGNFHGSCKNTIKNFGFFLCVKFIRLKRYRQHQINRNLVCSGLNELSYFHTFWMIQFWYFDWNSKWKSNNTHIQ